MIRVGEVDWNLEGSDKFNYNLGRVQGSGGRPWAEPWFLGAREETREGPRRAEPSKRGQRPIRQVGQDENRTRQDKEVRERCSPEKIACRRVFRAYAWPFTVHHRPTRAILRSCNCEILARTRDYCFFRVDRQSSVCLFRGSVCRDGFV